MQLCYLTEQKNTRVAGRQEMRRRHHKGLSRPGTTSIPLQTRLYHPHSKKWGEKRSYCGKTTCKESNNQTGMWRKTRANAQQNPELGAEIHTYTEVFAKCSEYVNRAVHEQKICQNPDMHVDVHGYKDQAARFKSWKNRQATSSDPEGPLFYLSLHRQQDLHHVQSHLHTSSTPLGALCIPVISVL